MIPLDWKDRANYPDEPEVWSSRRWAWEFLRRNQAYQDEFRETLAASLDHRRSCADGWTGDTSPLLDPTHTDFAIPGRRLVTGEIEFSTGEWGIAMFVNPQTDDPSRLLFFPERGWDGNFYSGLTPEELTKGDYARLLSTRLVPLSLAPGKVAVILDFAGPLTPQLRELSRRALAEQERWKRDGVPSIDSHRQRRLNWPLYLRLLDATAEDVGHAEIADLLYPYNDVRRVSHKLEQARRMVKPAAYLSIAVAD